MASNAYMIHSFTGYDSAVARMIGEVAGQHYVVHTFTKISDGRPGGWFRRKQWPTYLVLFEHV